MRFAVILAAVGLAAGLDTTNFAPPAPPCDMEHLAAREKGGYKIQCKGATILGDPNLDFEYFYLSCARRPYSTSPARRFPKDTIRRAPHPPVRKVRRLHLDRLLRRGHQL